MILANPTPLPRVQRGPAPPGTRRALRTAPCHLEQQQQQERELGLERSKELTQALLDPDMWEIWLEGGENCFKLFRVFFLFAPANRCGRPPCTPNAQRLTPRGVGLEVWQGPRWGRGGRG